MNRNYFKYSSLTQKFMFLWAFDYFNTFECLQWQSVEIKVFLVEEG